MPGSVVLGEADLHGPLQNETVTGQLASPSMGGLLILLDKDGC